jgi:hypothetical protein
MEFVHDSQRTTYDLVSTYLSEILDGEPLRDPEQPLFRFAQGSADVQIFVLADGDHSVVAVQSWVVTQVEPSSELFQFLLRKNFDFIFGAFAIDDENDILFKVFLYGDTLDQEELERAAVAVALTADEHDDEIISRFGGLAAGDR